MLTNKLAMMSPKSAPTSAFFSAPLLVPAGYIAIIEIKLSCASFLGNSFIMCCTDVSGVLFNDLLQRFTK